jgi:hypothetical protein
MGLLRAVARTAVVAGTATAVSNNVSRRQAGRWAAQEQQQQAAQYQQQQAAPPATPTGGGMEDKLAQLATLGQLRDQGVLSEAEFQAQKAVILGS